ncbi:recombination protein RecR [Candidatus Gracilibacteria bacterium]|nr:recombination protein RecR [Candidatus Gracilibacteria bacterium]
MLPEHIQKLIDTLGKLPGIGKKTAQRYAYFLMRNQRSLARDLGESLLKLEDEVKLCTECFFVSDGPLCSMCANPRRDRHSICVVEHIFDAEAIERSHEFRGLYHILHGRIAPLDNMMPDDIKIPQLVTRVGKLAAQYENLEVILATNPSTEGEATAQYIQRILQPYRVKITRIATGIPVGADLEYADEVTLARALQGRQKYE